MPVLTSCLSNKAGQPASTSSPVMSSPIRSSSNYPSPTAGHRSTSPVKRRFGSVNTTQDEGTEPTQVPDPFKQFRSAFQPCSPLVSDMDAAATRGATLDRFNQGMISCPELDQRATPSPVSFTLYNWKLATVTLTRQPESSSPCWLQSRLQPSRFLLTAPFAEQLPHPRRHALRPRTPVVLAGRVYM